MKKRLQRIFPLIFILLVLGIFGLYVFDSTSMSSTNLASIYHLTPWEIGGNPTSDQAWLVPPDSTVSSVIRTNVALYHAVTADIGYYAYNVSAGTYIHTAFIINGQVSGTRVLNALSVSGFMSDGPTSVTSSNLGYFTGSDISEAEIGWDAYLGNSILPVGSTIIAEFYLTGGPLWMQTASGGPETVTSLNATNFAAPGMSAKLTPVEVSIQVSSYS